MQDFSVAYTLRVKEDRAIHSVALPQELYENLIQDELGDICVFNGKGDPVPYFVRVIDKGEKVTEGRTAIPFFPMTFPKNLQDQIKEDVSVRVARNNVGTIVKVFPLSGTHLKNEPVNAYLLDLSNEERKMSELEFDWHKNDGDTLIDLTIEQSDDLVGWSRLKVSGSLANIHYKGNQVIKRKIAIGMDTQKYLKVTWSPLQHPFELTEVIGHVSNLPKETALLWTKAISAHQVFQENKIIAEFKLENKTQPERAQIVFPEKHSLMKLSVLSKKNEDEKWTLRCDALFYDFRLEGKGLRNNPCEFSATNDSEWRVSLDDGFANGIDRLSQLKITFGWRQHELLFVSQGEPPFLLAYGSGKFTSKTRQVHNGTILNQLLDDPLKSVIQQAELVDKVELGGDKALLHPAAPLPWKKWILWFVLIAGVASLAYMVRNLMSELRDHQRD